MPTKIKVFDTDIGSSITADPMVVQNNSWTTDSTTVKNLNGGRQPPVPLGDHVYAQAIYTKQNGDPGATADGDSHIVGTQPTSYVVPFPPEIDSIYNSPVTGTSQVKVNIKLTSNYNGQIQDYKVPYTTTGNWSIDVGNPPYPGTIFTAVAYYDGEEDQPSDPFVKWSSHNTYRSPNITEVTSSTVTINGLDTGQQQILAWRSSDGKKIVDQTIDPEAPPATQDNPFPTYDPNTLWKLDFIQGVTLSEHDQINLVSAFPDGGTMSPYDSKPQGYPQVQ